MNHIRGFFRPHPTTRVSGRPSVARDSKSQGSSNTSGSGAAAERASRTSPKPRRHHNTTPTPSHTDGTNRSSGNHNNNNTSSGGGGGGAAAAPLQGSSTSSVASGTALDHLYEDFRENFSAGEMKSQSGARKPCMVVREYNDEFIAPTVSNTSVFLPRAYNIVGDDELDGGEAGEGTSGYGDLSDVLTRTQATATTATLLLKEESTADSITITTTTNTAATPTAHFDGPGSCSDVSRGDRQQAAPQNPLTTSKVLALNSEEDTLDSRSTKSTTKKQKKVVHYGRQVTPPSVTKKNGEAPTPEGQTRQESGPLRGLHNSGSSNGSSSSSNKHQKSNNNSTGGAEAAHESSQVRRYSVSSWSFLEEEAKIHGRVRRVVVPPPPGAGPAGTNTQSGHTGGGSGEDGRAAHKPSEVEVVRLNEALFTSSELSRWRHYQVTRMDSFMGASNEIGTPSASTRSRDAPSSNSASGPEFMPMLAVTTPTAAAAGASEASTRAWEDFEGEGEEAHLMGVPAPRGRLIRVCCVEGNSPVVTSNHSNSNGGERGGGEARWRRSAVPSSPSTAPPRLPQHVVASAFPASTTRPADGSDPLPQTAEAPAAFEHAGAAHGGRGARERDRHSHQRSPSSGSSSDSSPSRSTSRSSSNTGGSHSDDGTLSEAASSATSDSASRSSSIDSLDADGATIVATATTASVTSDSVQLPDIFNKDRAHPKRGKTSRNDASARNGGAGSSNSGGGSDVASALYSADGSSAAEEFHPLPPVTRPHGTPMFRRRVFH